VFDFMRLREKCAGVEAGEQKCSQGEMENLHYLSPLLMM
jgi:hypothetical protein